MKHTIEGFIAYRPATKYQPEPRVTFLPFDPSEYAADIWGVLVRKETIEIEVPDDFDPRPQQVAALEAEKQKVRAEFAKRITDLDNEIGKLLAISNEVEA